MPTTSARLEIQQRDVPKFSKPGINDAIKLLCTYLMAGCCIILLISEALTVGMAAIFATKILDLFGYPLQLPTIR